MSVSKAILIGSLVVNGPVVLLICAPFAVGRLINGEQVSLLNGSLGLFLLFVGIVLGWVWWSCSVPRWRIWAYERVADIPTLKRAAVSVGITWPDGLIFSRTEIKTNAQISREQQLEQPPIETNAQDHPILWYYAQNGMRLGPVERNEIGRMVAQSVLKPDTLMWCEGMSDWLPLSSVPEFISGSGVRVSK